MISTSNSRNLPLTLPSIPLLERVKAMDVPVIGIVTDKEKGLVPAVQAVFPEVPYHFCHTHFTLC